MTAAGRYEDVQEQPGSKPPDARLAGPALAAWGSAALSVGLHPAVAVAAGLALLAGGAVCTRRKRYACALVVLAAAAAAIVAGIRVYAVDEGPLPALADERAVVQASLTLTSDPALRSGRFGDFVVVEARVEQVQGRGEAATVNSPVLVLADPGWQRLALGTRVRAVGRLEPATSSDVAAVFQPSRLVGVEQLPAWWWRAAAVLRRGIADSVSATATDVRALVPALVDGDDSAIPAELADAFRACGLTHLLAVSGTNLTLVVGFLLLVSRWCGVRGYATMVVGFIGTAGFVLLARPEPSVVRAAAMGLVALAGLGAGGRRRGVRALSLAVLVLVLVDPWLSRSIGFVLSVCATGGILVMAPSWAAALARWLPRPVADAVAVPMAAQTACTPVIAAISGQVSLVAIAANLLAAAAVGPATVLGLGAGVLTLCWRAAGLLLGRAAGVPAWWIITVARNGAALPGARTSWDTGVVAIAGLGVACLLFCLMAPRLLARARVSLAGVALVAAWVVHPVSWGWPPAGWVMVACDVGQGDALVLNAGRSSAVVVDTGPDPALIDACLDRLHIDTVPLVVLTHLHADHVVGLPGVVDGRRVGEVDLGPVVPDDAERAEVMSICAVAGIPVGQSQYATTRSVGALAWQVLGPVPGVATPGLSGTARNNTSVVLAVTTAGIRLLLTGDVEPEAQSALLGWGAALQADVLKVPHHGSRYQDPRFLAATHATVAIISVGTDNDYGQPAAETIDALTRDGADVERTDTSGDIAVVVRGGQLSVSTR